MISLIEAEKLVLESSISLNFVEKELIDSNGCILAEDVLADRDFPPFNRVAMDGIAIHHSILNLDINAIPIDGIQSAGSPPVSFNHKTKCIEIMTGAVLPSSCTLVVRYEDTEIEGGFAKIINPQDYFEGKNIHLKGKDRLKGDLLLSAGTLIGPAEISTLATVGKSKVMVLEIPHAAIIATGDELVPVNQIPLAHQIRSSNIFSIQSALQNWNVPASIFHLKDDKENLLKELGEIIKAHKIIILSGGVSKGKFDFIPEVLEELGIVKKFHRVAQKPGKPIWFGQSVTGVTVFALPGNPVSTFMCLHRYFKPWLDKILGQKNETKKAVLMDSFHFSPKLTRLVLVIVKCDPGGILRAYTRTGNGSGDLASLLEANAFMELPAEKEKFKEGETFRIFPFNNII